MGLTWRRPAGLVVPFAAVIALPTACGADSDSDKSNVPSSDAAWGGSGDAKGPAGGGGTGGSAASTGGTNADANESCGNGKLEPPEQCDDANDSEDDACLPNCQLACGDGRVNAVETCDTAIPQESDGACLTQCDSEDPCRRARLVGAECTAACEYTVITANIDKDGCCPLGSNSQEDVDCGAGCGNGFVEAGETCDSAIPSGSIGACLQIAACDDGDACSIDVVAGDGTCSARCDSTRTRAADIEAADGCCPPLADHTTDFDCSELCGNGVLDGEETCDPDIPTGSEGACITSCSEDTDPCTTVRLITANPCKPSCQITVLATPENGDDCCDPTKGANANNDDDCSPSCGNGAKESGEDCDPVSPTVQCDELTCTFVHTAFRFTSISLRDPHLFTDASPACTDVTETFNTDVIDPFITGDASGGDAGPDGVYDLSLLLVFDPLDQVGTGRTLEMVQARCPLGLEADAGGASTCTRIDGTSQTAEYANTPYDAANPNSSTECLKPAAGSVRTVNPYEPAISPVTVGSTGCFVTTATTLRLDLGALALTFQDAQIGAQWVGSPASGMVGGLFKGFISEAQLCSSDAQIASDPVEALLPGATGVDCAAPACTNASRIDKDTHRDQSGWWFYFVFTAELVELD